MKRTTSVLIILFCASLLFLSGCTKSKAKTETTPQGVDLIAEAQAASDELSASINSNMQPGIPIIVTSLVDVDNVQRSSRFGRMFSELLASKLSRKGFLVKEIKMSQKDIFVRMKSGEFALSRDLRDIALDQNVQAVIVGTYAQASDAVYLSIRMINSVDDILMSSYDRELPLDSNVRSMLRPPKSGPVKTGSTAAK